MLWPYRCNINDIFITWLWFQLFSLEKSLVFTHGKILQWKPWVAEMYTVTKSLLADCLFGSVPHWEAVVFWTRISVHCDPSVALPRAFLTLVEPAGSDLCPGKAISAFCHSRGRCVPLQMTRVSAWQLCARQWICLCSGRTKRLFYVAVVAESLMCLSGEAAVSYICSATRTYQWLHFIWTVNIHHLMCFFIYSAVLISKVYIFNTNCIYLRLLT